MDLPFVGDTINAFVSGFLSIVATLFVFVVCLGAMYGCRFLYLGAGVHVFAGLYSGAAMQQKYLPDRCHHTRCSITTRPRSE